MIPQPLNRPMFTTTMGQPVGQQPQPQQQGIMSVAPITAPAPNAPVQLASLQNQQGAPVTTVGRSLVQLADAEQRVPVPPPAERPETEVETEDDGEAEVEVNPDEVNVIANAAEKSTTAALNENPGATPDDANASKIEAKELADSLTKGVNTNSDFAKLLEAVKPSQITDLSKYNEQAKKLLGIPEEKSDVPDWAAPMFLFGLKLMQGPVTSKQQGADSRGVSGLLSDVGAAAETGFAFFAKERSRKRAERAQIASLSMQIRNADIAQKKTLVAAYQAQKTASLNLAKAGSTAFNQLSNRAMGVVPEGQEEKKLKVTQNLSDFVAEIAKVVPPDQMGKIMLNPSFQSRALNAAVREAGITKGPMKLISFSIGGVGYHTDPKALPAARLEYNKANPNDPASSDMAFLTRIITGKAGAKYQGLVMGARKPDSTNITRTEELPDGTKVQREFLVNKAARDAWTAANPPPEGGATKTEQEAYASKLMEARKGWRIQTDSHVQGRPEFKERSFVSANGETVKYYLNEKAFNAAKVKDSKLTIMDVLNNPTKYKKLLGGTITDYSKLQPDLSETLVYHNGMKRRFVIDRNRLGRAIKAGEIQPETELGDIIDANLGRFVGSGVPAKENEKINVIRMRNGKPEIVQMEARNVQGAMAAFDGAEALKNQKQRTTSLMTFNAVLHQIDDLLPGTTSRAIDWAGSAKTLSDFIQSQLNVGNARAELSGADLSSDTRTSLNNAFSNATWGRTITGEGIANAKVARGQVKSLFINLAFSLASQREGGKLTDNDVRNALETLGWNGESWTQTPRQVLARMKVAAQTANDNYINTMLSHMNAEEKEKYLKTQDEGAPDMVEAMLTERARAIKGSMRNYRNANPDASLRYDRRISPTPTEGAAGPARLPRDQSFAVDITGNRGTFKVDSFRVPNNLSVIHNEVFSPGGTYSPIGTPAELNKRIEEAFPILVNNLGLSQTDAQKQINQYKKFFLDRQNELFE